MTYYKKNPGIRKEAEIVFLLNGKKFKEITSNNWRFHLSNMFGHIGDDEMIIARQIEGSQKPDFFIEIAGERHYVSMKTSDNSCVHQEMIDSFTNYLMENSMSERTIETILLYHYGDGTTDGTDEKRMEISELKSWLKLRIEEANRELNRYFSFINDFMERALFNGSHKEYEKADYIYFGDAVFGMMIPKRKVMFHLRHMRWGYMEALHIGPLTIRPHARYIGTAVTREISRKKVDVKWPNLSTELAKINSRYD